jgi:hypothetical protein
MFDPKNHPVATLHSAAAQEESFRFDRYYDLLSALASDAVSYGLVPEKDFADMPCLADRASHVRDLLNDQPEITGHGVDLHSTLRAVEYAKGHWEGARTATERLRRALIGR